MLKEQMFSLATFMGDVGTLEMRAKKFREVVNVLEYFREVLIITFT